MTTLPPLLEEVARVAGILAAIAIARRLGGQRMYVPLQPKRGHRLSRIVGPKAALLIGQHFGGADVTWPKAKGLLNRHDARWLAARRGWSASRIARHLGLTERHVRAILAGEAGGELGGAPDLALVDACPCCNRRYHVARPPAVDPRQIPLPLPPVSP